MPNHSTPDRRTIPSGLGRTELIHLLFLSIAACESLVEALLDRVERRT